MARLFLAVLLGLSAPIFGAELDRQRTFTLNFPTSDLVFDSARNRAYVANANTKEVLAVNLADGSIAQRYSFSTRPETLALRLDGKRLYVAMPTGTHDYYQGAHTGYVGEVNLETAEKVKEFFVNVDPFGIIATDQGWIVIPSGSGQWTEVVSFNAATGARINAGMIRHMSRISLHPSQTQFYTADTDLSPSDIKSWKLNPATGEITSGADAPYHGDHPMGGNVYAHANGTNVITLGGGVYTSSTDPLQDMRYVTTLSGGIVRAVYFDKLHKATFTASPSHLTYYGMDFQAVRQFPSSDEVRFMTGDSNTLTLVSVRADRTVFDTYTNPAAGAETNALPVASFTWTPEAPTTTNLITLDASVTSDDEDRTNLLFRWDFEADGTWDRDFTNTPIANVRYNLAGTKTIRLEVVDRFGGICRIEKTLNVPFAADPGIPGGGNPAFQLSFTATDVAFDAKTLRLFATDAGARKLVVMNLTNGFIEREFSFLHIPGHLAITPNGENLYVALVTRPHSGSWSGGHTGYVAQISLASLTKVREVSVNTDPDEIVATDRGLLAISGGSKLALVEAATGKILGERGIYMSAHLALHPTQEALYFGESGLSPGDLNRVNFNPFTGAIISSWDSPYHGDHAIGGQPFVTPDSRYVISQGSPVLSSSADRNLDLRFVTDLELGNFSWLHFDPENDAFFAVGSGWNWGNKPNTFRYYNQNLELVRSETLTNEVDRIFGTSQQLFLVERSANRTTVYPRQNPAGAAKFNQPPVAQFTLVPAAPTTTTPVQVDASTSTDDDASQLQFRWDWEADGIYDTEFTTNRTASHRYIRPGAHTIRLQVKDSFAVLDDLEKTVSVILDSFPGIPYGPAPNEPFKIPYRIAMAAFDPIEPRVFVIPADKKNVEVIRLDTGYLDRQFIFETTPVAITITPNGKRMFVAFSKGHEYWTGGMPHRGYVAGFDLETMTLIREMELPIDPADLVATDSGLLIISDGSDQWTEVAVFNSETGEKLGSSQQIYMGMQLALHPSQQIVYGTDTGISPADIHHFTLSSSGAITERWESPYHGDHSLGSDVFIFPDGSAVFSPHGAVLTSTTIRDTDLRYVRNLGVPYIRSVAFDTHRNFMASVNGDSLTFYNYESHTHLQTKPVPNAVHVGMQGERVAVISVNDPGSEIQFFRAPALTPQENLAPTVTLTSANTNRVLTVGSVIEVLAEGRDEDGIVTALELFYGTNQLSFITNSIFSTQLVIQPGTNEFYAVAHDNFGRDATSVVLRVFGNIPPTVRFSEPATDVSYNQLGAVTLRVDASDSDGTVAAVRFLVDGAFVTSDSSAPYEFQFTPSSIGRYTLAAEAIDDLGGTAISDAIRLTFGGAIDNLTLPLLVIGGTNVTQSSSTVGATRQKGEPLHAGLNGGKSVWWAWRAPDTGAAIVDTRGSNFDTLLAVYTGPENLGLITNLVLVASNDDDPFNAPASRVKFTAIQGTVYYIAVDGRDGVAGNAQIAIRLTDSDRPANDMISAAPPLIVGNAQVENSVGATKEPGEPMHAGNHGGASVWWRYENYLSSTTIQISTLGSTFDTVVAVYTNAISGSRNPPAASDLRLVAANDDASSSTTSSMVSFTPRGSAIYWIAVDGYNGAAGDVQIRVTRPGPQVSVVPANDAFTNAQRLLGSAAITNANTRWATLQAGEPQHAGRAGGASVWYRWTAPANGPVYVSTKGSNFDTLLAVYRGTNINALTAVASNDDDPVGLQTSSLIFNATAGTEYRIAVAGYQMPGFPAASGNVVFALNQIPFFAPRLITQWSQGSFSIGVAEGSGIFVVERSDDLANWTIVSTVEGEEAVHVLISFAVSKAFYRARKVE